MTKCKMFVSFQCILYFLCKFLLNHLLFFFMNISTQVDSRDWALNGNTISLDEDTVIDVPPPFELTERYCASLGHKANHSFTPNCKYDP